MERTVAQLTALTNKLVARIQDLEARLAQNSSNSGRPPSADPPDAPPPAKKPPTGKRRGGQPGHKGHHREMLPPEKVDAIVDHLPKHCWKCGDALAGVDLKPTRHQVTELPLIKAHTTEHREHALACRCGAVSHGEMPEEVRWSHFGPRLTVVVGVLAGAYRISQRNIELLLSDLFHVEVSLGSIPRLERRVSESVAIPVEHVRAAIVKAHTVHADETSWREAKQKAWLWVVATTTLAVFVIRKSRGADVARELLEGFHGILNTDRWGSYAWVDKARRQLCWAHLKRDFLGFADHGSEAQTLSESLSRERRRMMTMWHHVRDGTLARSDFQKRMRPVEAKLRALLRQGSGLASAKVAGKCREILKLDVALFTFVRIEDIEPTNNTAERALRHAVIWRKTSFGTDSESGSRFVERMLTAVTSLRLQRRNVIDWLTEAYNAKLRRQRPPSLLAITQVQPLALVPRARSS